MSDDEITIYRIYRAYPEMREALVLLPTGPRIRLGSSIPPPTRSLPTTASSRNPPRPLTVQCPISVVRIYSAPRMESIDFIQNIGLEPARNHNLLRLHENFRERIDPILKADRPPASELRNTLISLAYWSMRKQTAKRAGLRGFRRAKTGKCQRIGRGGYSGRSNPVMRIPAPAATL